MNPADKVRDSAAEAVDQLQRSPSPSVKKEKRQAGVLLDHGSDLIDTVSDQASEAATELLQRLSTYTKKKPLTALLIAVGAGALLISAARSWQSRR